MDPLAAGSVIGHRFVIERLVGAGGMGVVYRATDLFNDLPVALKLLLRGGTQPQELERFHREIRSVAELRHPAIVAYVAHGQTQEGQPYLAMEWLDGEDLGSLLRRRRIDAESGLHLALRISEALAAAHAQGVVHRDIKPSNIFLPDGQLDRAVLIDFGIARRLNGERAIVTRTGVLLGTPDYMAPEQARGQTGIAPAADVFSLGCVLFECLTGRPPFAAEHVTAVLAKILFDEAPRLRDRAPELPRHLDELVARMLAKEPGARLPDGAAVAAALRDLETLADRPLPPRTVVPRETGGEQHYFSLVLASEATTLGELQTLHAALAPRSDELTQSLRQLGADVEALIDGSLAAAFPPVPGLAPGDRATVAVRCALLVKERRPNHLVAVATGRGVLSEGIPRGEGIDRAALLLRTAAPPELVRTDRLTAELVASRFEVREVDPDVFSILGERSSLDESRPLLGRPTPCVGREQELGTLEAALAACIDEQSARVVVVRAGPGMGKSRLRHEFLRRVAGRHRLDVLVGRGDLMRAGAPYDLLASALRQRWSLHAADDPAALRRKLGEALARELDVPTASPGSPATLAEFFAELCGVPIDAPSAPLLAARRDPKLMLAQQTDALVALLVGLCRRSPVLLVLEDMQWADATSFALVDAALRALAEQPLMVVGFARPELEEQFPGLWKDRGVHDLRLSGLSRRAGERLVQHALGRDLDPQLAGRLLDQAGGNPLYLEELIRAAAEGKHDAAPATVLAMMHTRLLRFDPALRRALRAAACYGETFSVAGLVALLGGEHAAADVAAWLPILVEHELIVRQPSGRIPGDEEYAFRHALLREAAYSLSSTEDLVHDHRLAAEFLERSGERDPQVLAEHWLRAGDRRTASRYLLAAAGRSYNAGDSASAWASIERALTCDPPSEVRAGLHAIASWIFAWRYQWAESQHHATQAIEHAEPGNPWWCSAMTGLINLCVFSDQLDRFAALTERYLATEPTADAEATYAYGLGTFVALYTMFGRRAPAAQALARLNGIGGRHSHDAGVQAWIAMAHSDYHRSLDPDPARQLAGARIAARLFEEAGDRRNSFFAEVILGQAEWETGNLAAGEAVLRDALVRARALRDNWYVAMAAIHLAAALIQRPEAAARDEAARLAGDLLRIDSVSPGYRAWAHGILAQAHLARDELDMAEDHAAHALQAPSTNVLRLRVAAAIHMHVLLARGRVAEARALAAAERTSLAKIACGYAELPLRLAIAAVLRAADEPDAAAAELREALAVIDARARRIADPEWRARFLAEVPAHAQAHAQARAWGLALPRDRP